MKCFEVTNFPSTCTKAAFPYLYSENVPTKQTIFMETTTEFLTVMINDLA